MVNLMKDSVMSFRVKDLRVCLKMIRRKFRRERKAELQQIIIAFIDAKFADKPIPPKFFVAIMKLEQRLNKISRCRQSWKISEHWESPFFDTIATLYDPTKIITKTVIYINIPRQFVRLFFKKNSRHKKFNYELQIRFGSDVQDDENAWTPMAVRITVNNESLEVLDSPPILYITPYCSYKYNATNMILVEFPFSDREILTTLTIVRRISVPQLLQGRPIPSVLKTQDLVGRAMDETEKFVHEVTLLCPKEKKPIQNPCRSSFCSHPEVFDVSFFLEVAQYYPHSSWKCPICTNVITYESLELETYFRNFVKNKKLVFTFYRARKVQNFMDHRDPEFASVYEVINID